MGYEEEENSAEQDAETYAHESSESLLEGILRYEILACLTGRSAPVPPAETLQTGWTRGSRHRTIYYLAAFVHDLTFPEDALHFKLKVLFLSCVKYSTWESAAIMMPHLPLQHICMVKY